MLRRAILFIGLFIIPSLGFTQDALWIENKTRSNLVVHFYSPTSHQIDQNISVSAGESKKIEFLKQNQRIKYGKRHKVCVEICPTSSAWSPLKITTEFEAQRRGRQVIFESALEFPKESSQPKIQITDKRSFKKLNLWNGSYALQIEKKNQLHLILEEEAEGAEPQKQANRFGSQVFVLS